MVFNATFINISVISWQSSLLVEETGGHGENAKHLQVRAKAGWLRARIMYFELSIMATHSLFDLKNQILFLISLIIKHD
jgi:hypothetical protein